MPMKLRKNTSVGVKFDCPDKNCTVCKTSFRKLESQSNAEGAPEDFVLDRV